MRIADAPEGTLTPDQMKRVIAFFRSGASPWSARARAPPPVTNRKTGKTTGSHRDVQRRPRIQFVLPDDE